MNKWNEETEKNKTEQNEPNQNKAEQRMKPRRCHASYSDLQKASALSEASCKAPLSLVSATLFGSASVSDMMHGIGAAGVVDRSTYNAGKNLIKI